jgi:hypothetical protein
MRKKSDNHIVWQSKARRVKRTKQNSQNQKAFKTNSIENQPLNEWNILSLKEDVHYESDHSGMATKWEKKTSDHSANILN